MILRRPKALLLLPLLVPALVEACATATKEELLVRGSDETGGKGGSGALSSGGNGAVGLGGGSPQGGTAGAGKGGTAGKGGAAGVEAGAGGVEAGAGGQGGSVFDPCAVAGAPADLRVDYKRAANAVTEDPGGEVHLVNDTNAIVPLSELSVRYWFRSEFSCADTATNFAVNITFFQLQTPYVAGAPSAVAPSVVELVPDVTGCEAYFALGFTTAAGSLEPGQRATIGLFTQIPIYTRTHDQTNDYSYGACTTAHVYWDRIAVYRNGRLVTGREPGTGDGGAGGEAGSSGGVGGAP